MTTYDVDIDEARDAVPTQRTIVTSYEVALEVRRYLGLIANGIGYYNAGAEVGWSPRKVRQMMAEPEMLEMIRDAEQCTLEDVEAAVIRRAKRGNIQAAALVLFNKAPEKWKPAQQRLAVTTTSRVEIAVVEAARQTVTELFGQDMTALQIGGVLDAPAIDATATG